MRELCIDTMSEVVNGLPVWSFTSKWQYISNISIRRLIMVDDEDDGTDENTDEEEEDGALEEYSELLLQRITTCMSSSNVFKNRRVGN